MKTKIECNYIQCKNNYYGKCNLIIETMKINEDGKCHYLEDRTITDWNKCPDKGKSCATCILDKCPTWIDINIYRHIFEYWLKFLYNKSFPRTNLLYP